MNLVIREAQAKDVSICGEICYAAFKSVAEQHGFTADLPNVEVAQGIASNAIEHPNFYGVVAELEGKVIGSNFLDERSTIAGIGPITVDPNTQNRLVGRQLMQAVINRAQAQNFVGIRLVQAAFNNRSLSLYAKLGFNTQQPLAIMQGEAISQKILGYEIRTATKDDFAACNTLCHQIHGHDRAGELTDAIEKQQATVVEFNQRIVGYSSSIGFGGHSVAESNDGLKALICAAEIFQGPGILVPLTNHELFRWCLANGLRVGYVMNLMTIGLYNQPQGSYLPSVLY
ncbi:GNAT family N-acetyltransferase [Candidatus Albibeggiatoa sp. nov. NOAA]|uniref:GNAT family N-acetyltransferase n=1 Tax=Candidatus Albibeggiatoa sp. nov. NOAA TaxID=3162724 RepID=UPI00330273AD|nr:GNAT family N-acetyltransferase [Thiotrichaceae bacterium]